MSDALSNFISGLKTLDPSNLGAPQNAAALQKFQSLDGNAQRQVLTELTAKHGTSFDELSALNDTDKRRVMDNMKNGRGTFDGVTRPQAEKPKSFNEQWVAASQGNPPASNDAYAASHADFAKHHGEEAARRRHGYINPERERQLSRIAEMQKQARVEGKSFSDVADARVRSGQ